MPISQKDKALAAIKAEVIALEKSPLYAYRAKNGYFPVIGEGNHEANIIFIGEAPGKKEAETGRPFVGASGKVLDEMLTSINIKREDVYITNIVNDRPPENRDPSPAEIKLYTPFLTRQIDIIKPKVVATLGRFAMTFIMEQFGLAEHLIPIGKAHGRPLEAQTSWGKVIILPLYHPAVALYNGSTRSILKNDFKQLEKYIK